MTVPAVPKRLRPRPRSTSCRHRRFPASLALLVAASLVAPLIEVGDLLESSLRPHSVPAWRLPASDESQLGPGSIQKHHQALTRDVSETTGLPGPTPPTSVVADEWEHVGLCRRNHPPTAPAAREDFERGPPRLG